MSLTSLFVSLFRALGLGRVPDHGQTFRMEDHFFRLPRDRYAPDDLLKQLSEQAARQVTGAWEWELEHELCEIGITLPDAQGAPDPEARAFLVDVLRQVRTLDNLVQQSCEEECVRSGLGSAAYELALGWIWIQKENLIDQTLALTYYGMRVNTDWDAKFKRDAAGTWQPVNFLQPASGEKQK
ncbi:hypothetical protein [Prosthecobacter sp.]|uniref:hypothetical protein n=1 Tax=Prosthecobacter sp. TaxID=1965333 RepID=UPI003784514E